ncbi:MAG: DUF5362 family protein [Flavobacterium sp. JAD_PAG50586_2]|jgi:hypothetical protein|nr:MAG: DUF5362 family protein [Flavobacterium sp. JAD_PAG50586_2]
MEDQDLKLNDFAVAALRESGKWCMFLSILGFIFIGLFVLMGIFMSFVMSAMPTESYGPGMENNPMMAMKGYFGIFYIIMALVYFFPVYYLYNYAKGVKQALELSSSEVMATALVNLKSHHKFLGIMTIVMISLYILILIGVVIFAASYASSGAGM